MPTIRLSTDVDAPVGRVFDLARDVDVHAASMAPTDEQAVAGVTGGRLAEGDRVTWRARHFGLPLALTVEVTELDRPRHFRDELVAGPLSDLVHDHHFEPTADGTRMTDAFRFASPLGPLGTVADVLYLRRYFRRLLEERNRYLKAAAEDGGE